MDRLKFLRGFMLGELMIMMVILMMLAGIMIGVSRGAIRRAYIGRAEAMIASIEIAVSMYHTDTGVYPRRWFIGNSNSNLLLVTDLTIGIGLDGWRGPYIEFKDEDYVEGSTTVIADPWGNMYRYYTAAPPLSWGNTNSFNFWSDGPNDIDDTWDGGTPDADYGDDVHNW